MPSPGLIVTIVYSAKYVKEEVTVEHAKYNSCLCVEAIGNIIGLLGTITDKLSNEVGFIGVKFSPCDRGHLLACVLKPGFFTFG